MRHFNTGDVATDSNLSRLDRLSSSDHLRAYEGDGESVQQWLMAVIPTIPLLPEGVRKHFDAHSFRIAPAHFHWSDQERPERWRALATRLAAMVEKAAADPLVTGRQLDGSGRPETRGEKVETLCAELSRAGAGTPEFDRALTKLDHLAVPGIRADVAKLRRLSGMKRIPDDAQWRREVARLIYHMRIVAGELHYLD